MPEQFSEFVLYYQASGPAVTDSTPIVLAVGTRERCERLRTNLMKDPQFLTLLARERHGSLQIAPSGGSLRPVPRRIRQYGSRVSGIGAIAPI